MGRTISDIAKLAGVSKAAVSYVLNGRDGVGEATRIRVLEVIRETGYRPSRTARGLAGKGTGLLGLIIPDISDMFYIGIVRGMEGKANAHGYTMNLCTTHAEAGREERLLDTLSKGHTDGVAFMGFHLPDEAIARRARGGTPLVVIGRRVIGAPVHSVSVDNREVGLMAASHLFGLGHTRIAFIAGPGGSLDSSDRYMGYARAHELQGVPVDPGLVAVGEFQREAGRQAALDLLRRPNPPTAVFAANDQMALGALSACKDLGLSVPGDVSIIGVDDIEAMSLVNPKMTSVRQPTDEMGAKATEILIGLLEGGEPQPMDHVLPVTLVERESCSVIK